jgi:hypothetical protein
LRELPIGVQAFPTLIRSDFAYVDKTELIYRLVKKGICYFLSRPRRFGKSLLVSALASLFRGTRELFNGLWISESDYSWEPHPVIQIDFSRLNVRSPELLITSLNRYLVELAIDYGLSLTPGEEPAATFARLVRLLRPMGSVVVLIDEYDYPIVRNLTAAPLAEANRQELQSFFTTVKSLQEELRFVFVTGVSRFSKVSLFSGMNNLNDISLDPFFATLTGLTEGEIQRELGEHIRDFADQQNRSPQEVLDDLRYWYNGYRFSTSQDSERVFNPWSILNCLDKHQFSNYWFESGTPSFVIKLLKERGFFLPVLESGMTLSSSILGNHDLENVNPVALLLQTGYLTVDYHDQLESKYHLSIPNEEVRRSLFEHLFADYAQKQNWEYEPILQLLVSALRTDDLNQFFLSLNQLLATVPYPLHVPREAYYHSLLFLSLRLLGFEVNAEVFTNQGRIDLVVKHHDTVYVFEFKIDASAREALDQALARGYAEKYESHSTKVVVVGANFSSATRNLDEWLRFP